MVLKKKWSKWCQKFNFTVFPVNKEHLMLFISSLVDKAISVSLLNNILYSISWVHGISGFKDPCKSSLISKMREGAKRMLSKPVIKKEPITPDMLHKIVLKFGKDNKNLLNLRFVAMCLLGFFGFLRYSELVNLKRSDFRIHDDRLELFIEKSKTDKFKSGAWIVISATKDSVCPKLNLQHYFSSAKIKDDSNDFIFRSIIRTKSGYKLHKKKQMSYTRAREVLLKNLEIMGLPKSRFGLHSLRSGGATAAGNAGVPDRLILKHGRWKSESTKDSYIHENLSQKMLVTKKIAN